MNAPAFRRDTDVSDADLAALTASRLCHDLVSPIGAIGNGVELLGMSGASGPEMDLIAESVEGASARLQYFRLALGAADEGQTVEGERLSAILESPHRGGRVRMSWGRAGPVPRPHAKLAFLLLMCVETALVQGGTAAVSAHGTALRVDARGSGIRADPGTWGLLTGGRSVPPTPATVQFALAAQLARTLGVALSVDMSPDRLTIIAAR